MVRRVTTAPIDEWTDRLRAVGLRVTPRRLAVLTALDAHPHSSADDVLDAASTGGSVTRQGVYAMLNEFADRGLVRRIAPPGSPARYETRTDDNHHHLICEHCGDIVDVDCAVGHAPCLEPSDAAGFEVHVADVTYFGTCPNCRAQHGGDARTHATTRIPTQHEGAPE